MRQAGLGATLASTFFLGPCGRPRSDRPSSSSPSVATTSDASPLAVFGGPVVNAGPPPDVPTPGQMRDSVAPLVEAVKDAVVTIQSTKIVRRIVREDPWSAFLRNQGFGLDEPPRIAEERSQSLGSGFILDRQGVVLTNNHVVAGADEVVVKLSDERMVKAHVVGSDPATDVAVVRMESPPANLSTVSLGNSDRVRVGDYVLAIGNPLGLGQTVTMGIVSAKNRVLDEKLGGLDPRYEDFIQTDAAINQGNSGGPLFNFKGEVVGINSAIINPGVAMNVGFAIPINLARRVAEQLLRGGKVARGFLGVGGEDFTPEHARMLGVPFVAGALLNSVTRGGPAFAAGLRPNDVVVQVNETPIASYRRLTSVVAQLRPGESVRLAFVREGRRLEANVVVGSQGEAGEKIFLGVEVRPLDAREQAAAELGPGQGLAVAAVDPRGPASGVLQEGDLLVGINRQPLTLALLKALEPRLRLGVRAYLVVQRGSSRFVLQL
jgi:Do/DeqQ family serine protease